MAGIGTMLREAGKERAAPAEVAAVASHRPSDVFLAQMRIQRERKGLTQRQLAARLGQLGFPVHQTTIGKWEAGDRRITLDEALAISVALDIAPSHMIAGSFVRSQTDAPSIALSAKTPPVSPRLMRKWINGLQPLWGQDEKRYFTEVSADEWRATRLAGMSELLRSVQELAEAWADDSRELATEIIAEITDELERQRRALGRGLLGRPRHAAERATSRRRTESPRDELLSGPPTPGSRSATAAAPRSVSSPMMGTSRILD